MTTTTTNQGTLRAPKRRWWLEILLSALGATVLIAYGSGASFRQDYVVLIASYGLLALGMYVPFIMSGTLSLAYNAHLGIGAYAAGILSTKAGISSFWGIPVGMVIAATIAVLLGMATRKLTGFYLAGVTLLFALGFETFILNQSDITGGSAGMQVASPTIFGYQLGRYEIMVMIVVTLWIIGLLLSRLREAPFGVIVRLRKDIPEAVEASGVNSGTIGLVALGLGAMIASIGGSMFAMMGGVAQPESYALHIVFLAIFMPLLGGQKSPWGAVLGAIIVVVFTFELQLVAEAGTLIFALAILLVLRFAPGGLLGIFDSLKNLVMRKRTQKGVKA